MEFLDACTDLLPDFCLKMGERRNCKSVNLSPRRSFLLRREHSLVTLPSATNDSLSRYKNHEHVFSIHSELTRLKRAPCSPPSWCSASCGQGWGWSIERRRGGSHHRRTCDRLRGTDWSHHTDSSPALLSLHQAHLWKREGRRDPIARRHSRSKPNSVSTCVSTSEQNTVCTESEAWRSGNNNKKTRK